MRSWTLHLPPGASPLRPAGAPAPAVPETGPAPAPPPRAPRLVPEGFSFWAFLFGPFWLFANRCWVAGLAALALLVALGFAPDPFGGALALGLQLLIGLHGHDLRRWTLARRGWALSGVVLGQDEDSALARALAQEPRLLPLFAAELR